MNKDSSSLCFYQKLDCICIDWVYPNLVILYLNFYTFRNKWLHKVQGFRHLCLHRAGRLGFVYEIILHNTLIHEVRLNRFHLIKYQKFLMWFYKRISWKWILVISSVHCRCLKGFRYCSEDPCLLNQSPSSSEIFHGCVNKTKWMERLNTLVV